MSDSPPIIYSFSTSEELSNSLSQFVIRLSNETVKARGRFTVGISGGSLPKVLAADLKDRKDEVDWDKWHVFFCDERLVPLDDKDSNYKLCQEELFDYVAIPDEQIHTINEDLLEDPEEVAEDYKDQLISVFAAMNSAKFPVFDLLLLGIGPDGHTCSLFPDHPVLDESVDWVVPIVDSPKPPPRRITLTMPVLKHAHNVAFVATGEGKQEMLHKVIDLKLQEYPSARVHPANGQLYWFLDDAASAKLKK